MRNNKLELELQAVGQELKSDMFDIIKDEDIVVPPMRRVADQKNQPEYHIRRAQELREQREREERERRLKEYNDRERVDQVKANSVIPAAVQESPKVRSKAQRIREEGCVVSTDSESDNDPTIQAKRAGYRKEVFKWTEYYENKLEELLITHMFDFIKAAYEFSSIVNNFEDENVRFYYEITPKILQMKWTDVEIKKYRIHEFTKDQEEDFDDQKDEVMPDLETFDVDEPVRVVGQQSNDSSSGYVPIDKRKFEDSLEAKTRNMGSISQMVNKFHEFSSSSDDEMDETGATNLEELD